MNLRLQSAVFSTIVLFGAMTGLTGCATTGMDRATKNYQLDADGGKGLQS